MHPEAFRFVALVKEKRPEFFHACRVLEVGSRYINGSVRDLFGNVAYVGVDCIPGPGVDWIGMAHEFPDVTPFDIAISTEAFEHDPHWMKTINRMIDLLRPGGLFVATWASPSRPEHGTLQSSENGESIFGPDPEYYKGLSWADFNFAQKNRLVYVDFEYGRDGVDCYVSGLKRKDPFIV